MTEKMPGYSVKMGFGLHQGWAIEGAIGSYFKIDASYLSPNVNIASRLEAATTQYGVHILVSEALHSLMTHDVAILCREIDRVTVKGSIHPLRLFTIDMDVDGLEPKEDRFAGMNMRTKKEERDKEKKIIIKRILELKKKKTYDIIKKDKDFMELRRNFDPVFFKKFRNAY